MRAARTAGADSTPRTAAPCHQTFTGITAFDKHRDGSHAQSNRHCLNPADIGLVDAGRDYPCWGFPGDPTRTWTTAHTPKAPK